MLDVRLKRITDLFIEGREVELGYDEQNEPVLIWVNKPNSFEEEESRRDGLAARTEHMLELKDDAHPDVANVLSQLSGWDKGKLIQARVNQKYDEDFMQALNDLESDKDWAERLEYLRRTAPILDDAGVSADDPRRTRYTEVNGEYMKAISDGVAKVQAERSADLADFSREELTEQYISDFREREAFGRFMAEKRVTELYFAIRDCQATRKDGKWDHLGCDHRKRLLMARADVRSLPQGVIETVINVLDNMSASPREAGNSAAPESSSASSEPLAAAEESTPSSPVETPVGVRLI